MSDTENGWAAFSRRVRGLPAAAQNWVEELREIPNRASDIAEATYGQRSARDASEKNAFRHALGTGMLAHKIGGGPLGAIAAKLVGYGWEAPTLLDPRSTPAERADSKHDLNANAVGAWVSMGAQDQAALVEALKGYAARSAVSEPPSVFARHQGRLTRSVQ